MSQGRAENQLGLTVCRLPLRSFKVCVQWVYAGSQRKLGTFQGPSLCAASGVRTKLPLFMAHELCDPSKPPAKHRAASSNTGQRDDLDGLVGFSSRLNFGLQWPIQGGPCASHMPCLLPLYSSYMISFPASTSMIAHP